ncbi:MAG: response regulator transcription factor [Clostridia bacterium]|nr:response regulator transcription factor [Clostridia bacterium]
MNEKVWIIDDEKELADSIARYFGMFGIEARAEYNAQAICEIPSNVGVVLLDINLGGLSGYDYIKVIRERAPSTKILLISARSTEKDMLKGYHLGADDYIVKPFSLQVLFYKVRNLLMSESKGVEKYKNLIVDREAMTITKENEIIHLKNMEFKLFLFLFNNRGKVLDKDEIIRNVWGEGYYTDNTLNIHIRRIREKLESFQGEFITTIWGTGYKFE